MLIHLKNVADSSDESFAYFVSDFVPSVGDIVRTSEELLNKDTCWRVVGREINTALTTPSVTLYVKSIQPENIKLTFSEN